MVSSTIARLSTRSMVGDFDLRLHFVVRYAAIFETQHLVGSGLGESVAEHIGVAWHRLGLRHDAEVRIVECKAMVHVTTGDVKLRRLSDLEVVRLDRPRPLLG